MHDRGWASVATAALDDCGIPQNSDMSSVVPNLDHRLPQKHNLSASKHAPQSPW
jgi:hypothetical protein